MNKMNKQVKKKWVAALRSGKYKQGIEKLCSGNQNGTRYCCLGVLSQIAVNEGVCSRRAAFKGNSTLNKVITDWAGLDTDDPDVFFEEGECSLVSLNDSKRLDFKQIARSIDKSL